MSNQHKSASLFAVELLRPALVEAIRKLNPVVLYRNPVMFTVELGTAIMLVMTIYACSVATAARVVLGTT